MITEIFSNLGLPLVGAFVLCLLALVFSSYVKISTILSIVKLGFGFDSLPSSFVTASLALVLTYFVMYPQIRESNKVITETVATAKGAQDLEQKRIAGYAQAAEKWKSFIEKQSHQEEVNRFTNLALKMENKTSVAPTTELPASWRVLAPAFVVSELKEAFKTGLNLFLPLLIVDLLVALILAAIDFNRLNPSLIALPLKILLFITLDGWSIITTNIISTY